MNRDGGGARDELALHRTRGMRARSQLLVELALLPLPDPPWGGGGGGGGGGGLMLPEPLCEPEPLPLPEPTGAPEPLPLAEPLLIP